jgi:hypothetical protein
MCDMRFARSSKWPTFILHHLVGECDFLYKRPFRVVFRGFVMIRVRMVLHMNTRKLVTEFINGEISLHVFVGFATGENLEFCTKAKSNWGRV